MSKLSKHYLSLTFLIMLAGWGTCLLCSLNGISTNNNKLLFVPYALGGVVAHHRVLFLPKTLR